jgi:hypothetical protein
MALKPSQITRRNFVQRAGLLVSALGVGAGVQSGLMDAIVKKATGKWGGEALAGDPGTVAFSVHIYIRAGWQNNSMFPSMGEARDASRASDLNIYVSQANIKQYALPNANTAANPTYFSGIFANEGADAIGQYLANPAMNVNGAGLATTGAIKQTSSSHTAIFPVNAPNTSAPSPAALHGFHGPAVPVPFIEWNNGVSATTQRGNLPGGATVKDTASLQALFKDLPMYFTKSELQLIAGTFDDNTGALNKAGVVDDFDKLFLAKNIPGSADVAAISLNGRNQSMLSVLANITNKFNQITANGTGGNFVVNGNNVLTQNSGSTMLGTALANAAACFSAGVSHTFTISLDFGDGHSDHKAVDDNTVKWATVNRYIGNAVTGFLKSMDQLTSPITGPTAKMSSSFMINCTSEFSRTLTNNGGSDNGDGGPGGHWMIGSKVKSGSFGNVTGQAAQQGFDPTTGATVTGTNPISEANVWKAAALSLGLSTATVDSYVAPSVMAAKAMVR